MEPDLLLSVKALHIGRTENKPCVVTVIEEISID